MADQLVHPDHVPARSIHEAVHARLVTAHLREELRQLGWDLVGRPERDELTPDDRLRLEAEIEAVAEDVLARATATLERELAIRIEALPVGVRLTLANVRRRRELGFD